MFPLVRLLPKSWANDYGNRFADLEGVSISSTSPEVLRIWMLTSQSLASMFPLVRLLPKSWVQKLSWPCLCFRNLFPLVRLLPKSWAVTLRKGGNNYTVSISSTSPEVLRYVDPNPDSDDDGRVSISSTSPEVLSTVTEGIFKAVRGFPLVRLLPKSWGMGVPGIALVWPVVSISSTSPEVLRLHCGRQQVRVCKVSISSTSPEVLSGATILIKGEDCGFH